MLSLESAECANEFFRHDTDWSDPQSLFEGPRYCVSCQEIAFNFSSYHVFRVARRSAARNSIADAALRNADDLQHCPHLRQPAVVHRRLSPVLDCLLLFLGSWTISDANVSSAELTYFRRSSIEIRRENSNASTALLAARSLRTSLRRSLVCLQSALMMSLIASSRTISTALTAMLALRFTLKHVLAGSACASTSWWPSWSP